MAEGTASLKVMWPSDTYFVENELCKRLDMRFKRDVLPEPEGLGRISYCLSTFATDLAHDNIELARMELGIDCFEDRNVPVSFRTPIALLNVQREVMQTDANMANAV